MSRFQDVLKHLRKQNGLSQLELGEALGIGKSTISMYESGQRKPSFEVLEAIADFFNVDMDYLLGKSKCRNKYQDEMINLDYVELANRIKERRLQMNYSYQELADKVGMSKSTLQRYETGTIKNIPIARLKSLSAALDMDPNELIGIKGEGRTFPAKNLLPPPETYQVPRLGQIACGAPILAEQNIETYDSVPVAIRCDFTLLCKGDSMIGAGIEDGDIVYIREQPEVETGEIAAVMVGEDEATLKRFKRVGNTILLIPENSNYEPLVFSGGEMNGVRILGKAVGFTRQFEK